MGCTRFDQKTLTAREPDVVPSCNLQHKPSALSPLCVPSLKAINKELVELEGGGADLELKTPKIDVSDPSTPSSWISGTARWILLKLGTLAPLA